MIVLDIDYVKFNQVTSISHRSSWNSLAQYKAHQIESQIWPIEQVLTAKSETTKEYMLSEYTIAWESIQPLHSLFWGWQFPFQSPELDKWCPTVTLDIQIVILW